MPKKTQDVKRIIEKFAQELKKLGINPERITLYGSYAKGNPREGSDIDLIVVSDDFRGMNIRERLEILGLAAGKTFEPIESLGYTREEVEQRKETFLESILDSP